MRSGKKTLKTMKETEFCTLSSNNEVYFPEAEMIFGITGQQRANKQLQVHLSVLHLVTCTVLHVCVKVRIDTGCCRTAGLNFCNKKSILKHCYVKGQQYGKCLCVYVGAVWEQRNLGMVVTLSG